MEWEKISANHVSDKELLSRIYKELLQLDNKKSYDLFKKWAKDLNIGFSKEDIQIAHQHLTSIPTHKGNANQNHEIPLHTHWLL